MITVAHQDSIVRCKTYPENCFHCKVIHHGWEMDNCNFSCMSEVLPHMCGSNLKLPSNHTTVRGQLMLYMWTRKQCEKSIVIIT